MKIEHAVLEDALRILDLQKTAYRSEAQLYVGQVIEPMIQTLASADTLAIAKKIKIRYNFTLIA